MRMFLSVSGHSSELCIANYSSRRTVSQLKCADLRITNHRRQKHPPSFGPLSFKTRIKWSLDWPQPRFSGSIFSIPAIFKATSKLFVSQGCSDDKTWLDFSSIFLKICRYSLFNSAFAVSFHSTRSGARVRFDSRVIFLDQLQFFATHSNQWNCFILYRP